MGCKRKNAENEHCEKHYYEKKLNYKIPFLLTTLLFSCVSNAQEGNSTFQSFNKAKKALAGQVYSQLPNKTLYCGASFKGKKVIDSNGFYSSKYKKRGKKIEWEHVVPAENFGRSFSEWRNGDPLCVTKKGKSFKGRNCASNLNKEYRYMQADLYNLYPAVGAVNALRSNYRYAMIAGETLGGCEMVIDDRKANPPNRAKGVVARVSLYFAETYKRYKLSDSQRKLFEAWDRRFPVTGVECKRNKIIEELQGNINHVMKKRCG
ncbi:MAG: endonuclease I [Methylomarinum sp.]|nr:endonuclease I [Methylomarinum sp.]